MRLVIFDIDDTLTQTMKTDEECFVRSLAEVCGFGDVDTDWSRYKHATDSGVFHEIHEARTGRHKFAHAFRITAKHDDRSFQRGAVLDRDFQRRFAAESGQRLGKPQAGRAGGQDDRNDGAVPTHKG